MRLLIFGNGYHTNKNLIPMVSEYQDRFSHVVVVDPYLNSLTKKLQGFQYAKSVEELSSEQFDVCWLANSTKKHSFALKQMLKNVVSRIFLIEKPMFTNLDDFSNLPSLNGKIFEACMYKHHKCWRAIRRLVSHSQIKRISSSFLIPMSPAFKQGDHWDVDKIVHDVGYYPIHSMINSLNVEATELSSLMKKNLSDEICNFTSVFNWKRAVISCEFGIAETYKNQLLIEAEDRKFIFDFVFSKPNHVSHLTIEKRKQTETCKIDFLDENHFYRLIMATLSGEEGPENITSAKQTLIAMNRFLSL